ncbi:MAG TPA: hypothetical protein DCP69_03950 [Candidatus Omnitrophica bacterium]|nr:hypothetical protein [Candidatus Omnitrophota bacterium]
MEQWYAIYEIDSGRLRSWGSVIADDSILSAAGLAKLLIPGPPPDDQMWDEATRTFVPRPPRIVRDLVEEFVNDTEFPNVNAAAKDKVRQIARRVFADFRFQ